MSGCIRNDLPADAKKQQQSRAIPLPRSAPVNPDLPLTSN